MRLAHPRSYSRLLEWMVLISWESLIESGDYHLTGQSDLYLKKKNVKATLNMM